MPRKLTPRQIAARKNRRQRGPLTEAGRVALREAALRTRPWMYATGPRTVSGKLRSRGNAFRHGDRAEVCLPPALLAARAAFRQGELPPRSLLHAAWLEVAGGRQLYQLQAVGWLAGLLTEHLQALGAVECV